jgi:hypothetical protein
MRKQAMPDEPKSQYERFIDAARELDTDDDKNRFEAKLVKVARVPTSAIPDEPEPDQPKKRGRPRKER